MSNGRLECSITPTETLLISAINLEYLISQVELMMLNTGKYENFDARSWVVNWINRPINALGGKKPSEFLNTFEGGKFISNLIDQSHSGAYC